MTEHRWGRALAVALAVLASVVLLAACGDDDDDDGGGGEGAQAGFQAEQPIERNPANANTELTIGSKNFTEQKVLGEIFVQGLEAAGYKVEKDLNLGDEKVALKALEEDQIDAYPEYTGTALLSFLEVKTEDIPKDPQQAFEQVRDGMKEQGITAYPPTPFTSSNEVGLTQEKAEELGVSKISDLEGKSQDLTLYGSPECRQRSDCLLGLQEVYGLEFKEFKPVDIELRHEVLTNGQADLSIVFTTDPQIQRENFVLLEDDQGMFPPYNSTLLVRDDAIQGDSGDLPTVVDQIQEGLTAETMQELNARVDIDKKTPAQVAGEYLSESKLVE
jgi:osmoprotectant transport system substrate-binding protein